MIDDGNLPLDSHDSFASGVPHATFKRLRDEAPCHWTDDSDLAKGFWSLTRYQDISQANRDTTIFSSAQGIRIEDQTHEEYMARRTFQETDPPEHSATRRVVNRNFAKPVVAQFEGLIRELATGIFDEALDHDEFDAVEMIAKKLPMMMLGRILGVPDEDLDWLVAKGDALIGNTDPDFTDHVVDKMNSDAYRFMPFRSPAGAELYDYADEILSGKKPISEDGLMTRIMGQEDRMSDLDFKNFFCLLVAAGNDTTRYSIAMALYLITQNPKLLAEIKAGDVFDTAPDEFIRLASPTMHFRRTAIQDTELHGQKIREGDKVLLWFISGSRDDRQFERPNEAILSRNPNHHLAFGQGGPHVCLGMHLAKLELKVVLQELAARVSKLEAMEEPTWTRSNFICGVKKQMVRVERV